MDSDGNFLHYCGFDVNEGVLWKQSFLLQFPQTLRE